MVATALVIADGRTKFALPRNRHPAGAHQTGATHTHAGPLLIRGVTRPVDQTSGQGSGQDFAIVSLPGEPFAEIGVAIEKASSFAFTMFAGYHMPIADE